MKILKLTDVIQQTALSRSAIYKYISAGRFPQSISLGGRSVGWVESEVNEWIIDRIAERDMSPSIESTRL